MPCDLIQYRTIQLKLEAEERQQAALRQIERKLEQQRVAFVVGPDGALAVNGVSVADKQGMTDVCVLRRLLQENSAAAQQEMLRLGLTWAEVMSGVTAMADNRLAHSHNGGGSWGRH